MKKYIIIGIIFLIFALLYMYSDQVAQTFLQWTGYALPLVTTPQAVAKSKEGTVEQSSNYVPWLNDWFYGTAGVSAPWCMIAISYCYWKSGKTLQGGDTANGFSSVPAFYNKFSDYLTTSPVAGDIVIFDENNDGNPDHAGIFICDNGDGTFQSSEGNYGDKWSSVTRQFLPNYYFIHLN